MTYTVWSSDFSVGRLDLDGQHIALLNLCKRAAKCLEESGEEVSVEIREILGQLVFYTESHFREEERLMAAAHFPGLCEHRAEHIEYRTKLTGFLLDAGNGIVDRQALFDYLTDWWGAHILGSDKMYAPFIAQLT